ncbi:uncharacterized protein T551_01125 [Pneumocystis jirovecii RU7]|uniref:Autophagy-related protein 27 n=1 Tax=Pneumocystis jirovecii (strain RU7) TaxID=1408657 RepID=A0A0W4ZU24_PNEJ7|nr:uncharacterized protein T551_01125 [Pneumocystis jirovecii RU7]KTW31864.1 hypothetical protein T551_01125 [Pneumocystis jirovecii RU7]
MYSVLWVLALTGFCKSVFGFFNCNFEVDNVNFDLEALDNIYYVTSLYNSDEGIVNRTWSISLCRKLNFDKKISKEYLCSSGANICGVKTLFRDTELIVENVQGLHFDIYSKYLTNNGLQIFFYNAQFRENNLSAMINFICDEKVGVYYHEHDPKFISYSRSHLQLKWKTNTVCKREEKPNIVYQYHSWGIFSCYGSINYDFYPFTETVKNFSYYFKDYGSQLISFVKQIREPSYRGYTSI